MQRAMSSKFAVKTRTNLNTVQSQKIFLPTSPPFCVDGHIYTTCQMSGLVSCSFSTIPIIMSLSNSENICELFSLPPSLSPRKLCWSTWTDVNLFSARCPPQDIRRVWCTEHQKSGHLTSWTGVSLVTWLPTASKVSMTIIIRLFLRILRGISSFPNWLMKVTNSILILITVCI